MDDVGEVEYAEIPAGYSQDRCGDEEQNEPVRIPIADTGVDEDAVVVGAGDTAFAERAVF